MQRRRWNWPLWTGLALVLFALLSYFTLFARFPLTRDVPWVNFILFAGAIALLVAGVRRAFSADSSAGPKIVGALVTIFGAAVVALFLFYLHFSKTLPASHDAIAVGQKAPEFTMLDANRKPVSLDQLLSKSPRGVILVFYRGYW
jgi:hypothetical protein